jgi:hypothetical protein
MEKVSKLTEDFINFYEGVLSKPLDVEDPKLANAISLIQTGVLDWDNAKKLNENFKGDQVSLKMLKKAYESSKTPTGGIDKMIMPHSVNSVGEAIRNAAYYVIHQGGYPNHFSGLIDQLTGWLGVDGLETKIRPDPFTDNARSAAGLPEK